MSQILFTGRVVRVFAPTQYISKHTQSEVASRKFWAEDASPNNSKFKSTMEFTISHRIPAPSPNVAHVEDLDAIHRGHIIRFACEPQGLLFTNKRTGEEQVWNKMCVVSRIELIESRKSFQPRHEKAMKEHFQEAQRKAAQAQAVMEGKDPDDVSVPF